MGKKVKPLKATLFTVEELARLALEFAESVRDQLYKSPYEPGLTDQEFIKQVLGKFVSEVRTDLDMRRLMEKEQKNAANKTT